MICPECRAEYRSGFTRCADCDIPLVEKIEDLKEDPESPLSMDADAAEPDEVQPIFNPITCPRCEQDLEYAGTKRFHEGTNWGILGELGELFVKSERLDVYVCPNCGRVEFFVDGIGDEYRPR
jgi:hypothetical protein